VAELALDHVQRDALSRHFNCMGVAQLMRREATTDTGSEGQAPKLGCAPQRPTKDARPWVR